MPIRVLAFFALLVLGFSAAAQDLYSGVNRIRDGDGECSASPVPPLKPDPILEAAARRIAQGRQLSEALREVGYRSARSVYLSLTGSGIGGERAAGLLARRGYCSQLKDPGLTEMGVHSDGRGQVLLVIATPLIPAVALSEGMAGQRVLDLVNIARSEPRYCGDRMYNAAQPVRWNQTLAVAARSHAEDMARNNYFSHTARDGSTPGERVIRAGYRYRMTGENIAAGMMKPEDAMAGWMKSPGHCANLMNPSYTEMGAAYAVDRSSAMGVYWAQNFGTQR